MRVVIFSAYFIPHSGGVENYVYQLARRLAKNNSVFVVASKLNNVKEREVIDGIAVFRIPAVELLPERLSLPLSGVSSIINTIKPDIIVTNTRFYPVSFAAGMYAHKNNIPWLHIEHGTSQPYSNPLIQLGVRAVDLTFGRWIMRHASAVAGVSKASCAFAKNLGAKSCSVLYNGVDSCFFDGRRKSHKGVRIVFVGRLIKDKGIHDLLRAAKGLDAKVVIVGAGPYENQLKKLGGIFVGKKNSAGVRKTLSESDILVNPSYGEGMPSSVLEAGAMGLAVIATDVGGTGEIIRNGKSGFLVQPSNVKQLREKLSFLIKNPSLRMKMGAELQKKVRSEFDWKVIILKAKKVIGRLL